MFIATATFTALDLGKPVCLDALSVGCIFMAMRPVVAIFVNMQHR